MREVPPEVKQKCAFQNETDRGAGIERFDKYRLILYAVMSVTAMRRWILDTPEIPNK
jgi:hypothetical protein